MISRHGPRRSTIYGEDGIRDLAKALAEKRTHSNFTRRLSGGGGSGPYSGVRVVGDAQKHQANNDENLADFAGNYSKGLKHQPLAASGAGNDHGLVDPQDYRDFVKRLGKVVDEARSDPLLADAPSVANIDGVPRSPQNGRPFVNPLSGVAADLEGLDPFDIAIPPAPDFNGPLAAVEMIELYWMAVLRDLKFDAWNGNSDVASAIAELNGANTRLNGAFAQHREVVSEGPPRQLRWNTTIDQTTLFRGSAPGNDKGPYISQFLWLDVPFGTLDLQQKQVRLKSDQDYLTDVQEWHRVQEGGAAPGGKRTDVEQTNAQGGLHPPCAGPRRHIITLRDLTHYVHFDALHEAYFNAALILAGLMMPLSYTNIYRRPPNAPRAADRHEGFGTFGGPHVLVMVTEVATRALKAVWHQKWYVHRRLRPEASGGRIHAALALGRTNLADLPTLNSFGPAGNQLSGALKKVQSKHGNYLLPMAFPEGSPMHPAYGAGHATVAGACVTVLKALFEPRCPLPDPVQALERRNRETDLVPWTGSGALTVEGELNKLAANVAIGRNAAGVHYRSDYTKSLALGEAVAVAMLQEMALTFVEHERGLPVWALPTFDGHWIAIDNRGKLTLLDRPEGAVCPAGAAAVAGAARFTA